MASADKESSDTSELKITQQRSSTVLPKFIDYLSFPSKKSSNSDCLIFVMIALNLVRGILVNTIPLQLENYKHSNCMKKISQKTLLLITVLNLTHFAFAQKTDSTKNTSYFSGNVSVTNNGISIVPSFSLDKPAIQFMLAAGKKRLSFEPDIRFSMAGKPWSMLFWGRYKVVTSNKFNMNVGSHLGLNFRTSPQLINGDTSTVTIARRYLATELFPRYSLNKNISIGIYYLYSHGLDAGTIGNTHFVTFSTNFSHIKLSDQFFLRFNPQLYYLKLDAQDGYFFTSTLTVAKKNFPLSVSSTINKKINSNITGSKNLLWNVSLVYTFNNKYVKL